MRLVAITSANKPSIAMNASQRAIRARITPCMARPPEPRRPPADEFVHSVDLWRQNRDGNEESTGRICDEPAHHRELPLHLLRRPKPDPRPGFFCGRRVRRRCNRARKAARDSETRRLAPPEAAERKTRQRRSLSQRGAIGAGEPARPARANQKARRLAAGASAQTARTGPRTAAAR